jgi:hypothetical protein
LLICKGLDVGFRMSNGRTINAPKSYGMLHDPTGRDWSECSLLVAGFGPNERLATKKELSGEAKNYFGADYEAVISTITLPPKSMDAWTLVGKVKRLWYFREGKFEGAYKHDFNKPRGLYRVVFLVKGKRDVFLFKHERSYRLELGSGCLLSDLGVIVP